MSNIPPLRVNRSRISSETRKKVKKWKYHKKVERYFASQYDSSDDSEESNKHKKSSTGDDYQGSGSGNGSVVYMSSVPFYPHLSTVHLQNSTQFCTAPAKELTTPTVGYQPFPFTNFNPFSLISLGVQSSGIATTSQLQPLPRSHQEACPQPMPRSRSKEVSLKIPYPNQGPRYRSPSPSNRYPPSGFKSKYGPTLHEHFSTVIESNRCEPGIRHSAEDLEKITIDIRHNVRDPSPIPRHEVNPPNAKLIHRADEGHRPIFDREEIKGTRYPHEDISVDSKSTPYNTVDLRNAENYQVTPLGYDSHNEVLLSTSGRPLTDSLPGHEVRKDTVILDRRGYTNGGGPSSQEEIIVPRPAVGVVIGKNGDMIKRIQQDSGARVQFIQGKEDIPGDKLCQITGTMDQVQKASSLIRDLIQSVMRGYTNGGGPSSQEEIIVPRPAVGVVIGKNGDMIKRIQQDSGARVQFIQGKEDIPGDKLCQITGTMDQVQKASSLIRDLIQSVMRGYTNGGGPSSQEEIIVPRPAVGVVIGKNGDMIKRIQQDSGARVQFIQGKEDIPGDKLCQIPGTMDQVQKASSLIRDLIQSVMRGYTNGGGPSSQEEIIVPRPAVGVVIGKNGDMIKRIQQDSGARVQFIQGKEDIPGDKLCQITGTMDQVQKASSLIRDLIQSVMVRDQQMGGGGGGAPGGNMGMAGPGRGRGRGRGGMGGGPGIRPDFGPGGPRMGRPGGNEGGTEVQFAVPANKCGLVIGKGGETVRNINQQSGAHVEIARGAPPNPHEKIFIIRGNPQQIEHAKQLIMERVGGMDEKEKEVLTATKRQQVDVTPLSRAADYQSRPLPPPEQSIDVRRRLECEERRLLFRALNPQPSHPQPSYPQPVKVEVEDSLSARLKNILGDFKLVCIDNLNYSPDQGGNGAPNFVS